MKGKRDCRKCGEHIPNCIVIDGKRKNLKNRKFCLKCSIYKGHNTKPDDPDRPNVRAKKYANWSEKAKKNGRKNIYKRGHERKKKLIELAGGGCKECGYNKCMGALTFHHREPEKKKFNLTKNMLWSKSWKIVLEEFKKCDMLCLNCHMELEDEIKMQDPNYYRNLFNF